MDNRLTVSVFFLAVHFFCSAQWNTDVSLFYKKHPEVRIDFVESKRGNLFHKLGHHGPAVENPYFGLRLYFNKKTAIDVYSKSVPRMELNARKWYPSKADQMNGWGADYYKVGRTLGLGGFKLWDHGKIVDLHPVDNRSARVFQGRDSSYIEMVSEGVKYKDGKVDIRVLVIVYPDSRLAKVSAESLDGNKVQFVTGINYHDELEIRQTDRYIATWGIHPEDVAAEKVAVGAALFIPEMGISDVQKYQDQYILISYPVNHLSVQVTSANAREQEINTFRKFIKEIESIDNSL
ncbi:MAG: DUF4861 domain-containing protein [Bacteroidales bacterium]|nr:DUF4861 domain-containing protein [Bacteroidales bacterium]